MIRQFKFKQTYDDSQINWDTLTQNTQFVVFDPTELTNNLTGFSSGSAAGAIMLLGPLCYVDILLQNSPSWGANSYIDIPIQPLDIPDIYYPQFLDPLVDATTAEVYNNECPEIITGPEDVGRIVLKNSGSGTYFKVKGFFIRN